MEALGTSSDVLLALLELLERCDATIVATRELLSDEGDASGAFAVSLLKPRIQFDTDEEREKKAKLKARKLEEIARLQARIANLEAEVAELSSELGA
jgi:hypothetical protein